MFKQEVLTKIESYEYFESRTREDRGSWEIAEMEVRLFEVKGGIYGTYF